MTQTTTDLDTALVLLASDSRRRMLTALARSEPGHSLHMDEYATDEQTELQLRHNDLPKMADAGLIEWTAETGHIERGENWEDIAPLIRLMRDHEDELPDDWL